MSQAAPQQPWEYQQPGPQQPAPVSAEDTEAALRARATKRLEDRRGLGAHALAYVLVNGFLVVIWMMNGTDTFFWPVFVLLGWGIGLAFNAWDVLVPGAVGGAHPRRDGPPAPHLSASRARRHPRPRPAPPAPPRRRRRARPDPSGGRSGAPESGPGADPLTRRGRAPNSASIAPVQ